MTQAHTYKRVLAAESELFKELMKLFSDVFEDKESYQTNPPDAAYIESFLSDTSHVVLVALDDNGVVIGGLVAYELKKFEQKRSEMYIYDLAVSNVHQRQGVGSGLIAFLKSIAQEKGINTIFVQADKEDDGAVSFYRTLSSREIEGVIFDI